MTSKKVVFKREELYKRIWEIPIVRLSKEFGISDVALAKICNKLNVPKPPRGYWAKLEFKKNVQRPPLPVISTDAPREYVHNGYYKPDIDLDIDPMIQESIITKRNLIVSATLDNPHSLVKEAKSILEHAKLSDKGLLINPRRACLDVSVSLFSLDRALRIMDTLIKGLEAEGFAVFIDRDRPPSTYTLIREEKVYLSIAEDYHCIDHVLTQEEIAKKKSRPYWEVRKFDYNPTGELSLKILNSGAFGSRKQWSDTKTGKLEVKIGKFIGGAILVAQTLKKERQKREEDKLKWEEERRQREENEKKLAEEKARFQQLEKQVAFWIKSEQIRGFVKAFETEAAHRDLPEKQKRGIEEWVAWARKQADKMDPIKLSFPDI